jgi:hypothetical protein
MYLHSIISINNKTRVFYVFHDTDECINNQKNKIYKCTERYIDDEENGIFKDKVNVTEGVSIKQIAHFVKYRAGFNQKDIDQFGLRFHHNGLRSAQPSIREANDGCNCALYIKFLNGNNNLLLLQMLNTYIDLHDKTTILKDNRYFEILISNSIIPNDILTIIFNYMWILPYINIISDNDKKMEYDW